MGLPIEVVVIVLSSAALVVVTVMAMLGVQGVLGSARFADCPHCHRWTILHAGGSPVPCLRCRHTIHPHLLRDRDQHRMRVASKEGRRHPRILHHQP